MFMCVICGKQFSKPTGLGNHVVRTHKISGEVYYTEYLKNKPIICICGNNTRFLNMFLGYSKHCSSKCSYHDPKSIKKKNNTIIEKYGSMENFHKCNVEVIKKRTMEKYGVTSATKLDWVKEKVKKTFNEKYGVDNCLTLPEIRKKAEITTFNRYGVTHAIKSDIIKEKVKETVQKRYGVDYVGQLTEFRERIKQTNLSKYGFTSATKSDFVKEKTKKTNLERYGYEYSIQDKEKFKEMRNNNLNKYGYEYVGQVPEFKEKIKNTNLLKYGTISVLNSIYGRIKTKETMLINYGVDNICKNELYKKIIIDTNNKKYGVSHAFLLPNHKKTRRDNELIRMHNKYDEVFNSFDCDIIDHTPNGFLVYNCRTCNNTNEESWQFIIKCRFQYGRTPCIFCYPKDKKISSGEKEVVDFLSDKQVNLLENNRTIICPLELDCYLPDNKIAIEYNGVHYHNELYIDANYHLNKTNMCELKNIQLIHIFEDDWLYKKEIIKSRLLYLLRKSDRIFARNCLIKEVDKLDSKDFLDNNHLQGYCYSKFRYGLYYNNELVSLMTFNESRFDHKKIELSRFCSKINTTVVGGPSKLFKYFIRNHEYDEIISYADRSWSLGNVYEKMGFVFHSYTNPNYYYVNGDKRENKMKYEKHRLIKDGYDPNKTEHEIMLDRKMYRIYDSGNMKYIYKNTTTYPF